MYSMRVINKIKVLDVFIEHGEMSFNELQDIFHVNNIQARKSELAKIIRELEKDLLLERTDENTIQIKSKERAIQERNKLIEQENKKEQPTIGTQFNVNSNSGNIAQIGSESSLKYFSQTIPTTKSISPISNKNQKSFWSKKDSKKLVIGILITVIAAIICFFLKINK